MFSRMFNLFSRRNQWISRFATKGLDMELTVVFRHGDDGYIVAECLELPGCMSQGTSEPEAMQNIVDAIQSCLAVRLQQFLSASRECPHDLVGIESQGRLRVKPPELVIA